MNKLDVFTNVLVDSAKIADKKDIFKEFFNENDEFLSSSSWGNLIKFCAKKSIEISDINEAYYFTIFTTYLNTFENALEHYDIKENNFSIPKYDIQYNYKELDINNIAINNLVETFHTIFKEFIDKDEQNKIIKYIINNIKLQFYKVIDTNTLVLDKYIKYIKSDIFKVEQNDFQKELYNIEIEQEYKDIVLADKLGLTLEDLYIEPYFRVFKKHFKKDDERLENISYQSKYCEVEDISIHSFITDTLNGKNNLDLEMKDVNTIFISGYPGQGKSSFTKRFIYDILNDNINLSLDVILIKLKNIENPSDFLNKDIETIIKENIPFEVDSLDNYIVVLDGLDELIMKSSISIQDSNNICENIARSKTKVIVTTRHNYVDFDKLYEKNILTIELKELNQEQQLLWLEKYTNIHQNIKLTSNIIKQFHKNKENHILELINQPILLHMIADMNIDNIEVLDKSTLYKEFFNILINRKWEKDKHTLLDGIDEDDAKLSLRNMLQELALNIFQSEYEYIHKIDFQELESVKEFQKLLVSKNNESLQKNLKGVMVAFYFKEVKKDNNDVTIEEQNENYAIEFLHKSLMEYMVAEYIWEKVQDLLEKNRYGKYSFDEKQALELFWNLFSKNILSTEIVDNLLLIIEDENQDKKDELALRLDSLINYFLDKDFIYKYEIEDNNPVKKSIVTFYGFWTILSSLNYNNHIPNNKYQGQKVIELLKQFDYDNAINYNYCNFSNLKMYGFELNNCDSLGFVNFDSTQVWSSDWNNLCVYNCTFDNVNFASSHLCEVKFNKILFSSGMIHFTFMQDSHFKNSIFNEIEFMDLNILYSTFENTKFINCDFVDCILRNGNEDHPTLFKNVEFQDCTFNEVVFKNTKFEYCPKINFEDLKEQGAIFIDCTHNDESI